VTDGSTETRDAHLPGPGESWTPIRLTRWSGGYLQEKGLENGRLDAELLLAQVLDTNRLDLYLQFDRPIHATELDRFKGLLLRRAAREPLQYILGTTAFRELEIRTDSRALIPRPETEILVGEVLEWAAKRDRELTGLDVGTGSGVIALSLLTEGPFSSFVGTDSSQDAMELARENVRGLKLEERMEVRRGALFEPLRPHERFDVIVSNPPYIPEGERGGLQPEVRDWEPAQALFAGSDGLAVLLPLVRGAPSHLNPGGLFGAEVGEGQAGKLALALRETGGFDQVWVRPDLAGKERIVLGVATS
jgi:release factor glutamine methyltransferase